MTGQGPAGYLFDRDVSLTEARPFRFRGTISDSWSINGNPNGGYLLAVVAHAMARESDKKSTPIVTATYLAKTTVGEADLHVEMIARSTQFNRLQASLVQDGREKIRGLGTFADEKNECVIERYETGPPVLAPLDECISSPRIPGLTIFNNLEIRLDPGCAGWIQGKMTDKSEIKGWIRFRDGRPFDMISMFLLADAFPPAVFVSQGMVAWVPTIEMSVNVRNIPVTEWMKCVFRTRFITCGLFEEDGELWDEEGNLAAISRQIAQYRKSAP